MCIRDRVEGEPSLGPGGPVSEHIGREGVGTLVDDDADDQRKRAGEKAQQIRDIHEVS